MDKWPHAQWTVWWKCLSMAKLKRLHDLSLGMDKQFHPILCDRCNYVSMLGLQLIPVSKMGPGVEIPKIFATTTFARVLTICLWSIRLKRINGLAPAERYRTPSAAKLVAWLDGWLLKTDLLCISFHICDFRYCLNSESILPAIVIVCILGWLQEMTTSEHGRQASLVTQSLSTIRQDIFCLRMRRGLECGRGFVSHFWHHEAFEVFVNKSMEQHTC